ncbi:MAG: hypothetical protein J5861_04480 [Desulfovibrio sp.]|nr:hypothetical protein [Desulfovibrio sp.]
MAEALIYQRRGNQLVKVDSSTLTHANVSDVLDALQSAASSLNSVLTFLVNYYNIPASGSGNQS